MPEIVDRNGTIVMNRWKELSWDLKQDNDNEIQLRILLPEEREQISRYQELAELEPWEHEIRLDDGRVAPIIGVTFGWEGWIELAAELNGWERLRETE